MSFKAMAWATEQEFTQTSPQSHLLLILASFANEQNECYPSVETLSKMTRMDKRTIRKCLKELADLGIIIDTQKRYQKQIVVYFIDTQRGNNIDTPLTDERGYKNDTPNKNVGGTNLHQRGNNFVSKGGTNLHKGGTNLSPNPINKPIKEPINNPINNKPKKFDPCQIDLPQSVDKELWIAFVQMRIAIKKPLTEYAVKLLIKDLISFGNLANQSLENSIKNNYQGLFLPKTDAKPQTQTTSKPNFFDELEKMHQEELKARQVIDSDYQEMPQ